MKNSSIILNSPIPLKMKIIKPFAYLLVLFLFACADDVEKTTDLQLEFTHKAGDELFEYQHIYQNKAGNKFSLKLWRTYISHIELTKTDGEVYAVPDSYHLIEHLENSKFRLNLSEIPAGDYRSIQFYIGVADEENLSGEAVRDLNPSNNMAWNWTVGYKFIRMDGEFEDKLGNRRGLVAHIGKPVNLKAQLFTFQQPMTMAGQDNKLTFELDMLEAFQNPHTIDFEELSDFQFNEEADLIGENYAEGYIRLME